MESTINIYELFSVMSENRILLIYQGMFDQEMIKSVVSMTEKKLIGDGIDENIRKKLFNILVEGLQNICKHQLKSDEISETPFLIIGRGMDSFNVVTGNPISNENIDVVRYKIDHINNLSKDELKEYYKAARLNSVISEVGGAGLGFIDMARKSGNKLDYKFFDINESYSFFILNNKINNN